MLPGLNTDLTEVVLRTRYSEIARMGNSMSDVENLTRCLFVKVVRMS